MDTLSDHLSYPSFMILLLSVSVLDALWRVCAVTNADSIGFVHIIVYHGILGKYAFLVIALFRG